MVVLAVRHLGATSLSPAAGIGRRKDTISCDARALQRTGELARRSEDEIFLCFQF
jgi:hypothetical protein